MRALLLIGGFTLGILLVAASHQDQAGTEAQDKRGHGDLVKEREIRSTAEKRKNIKSTRRPGVFSTLSLPSRTREKRGDLVKEREIRSTGESKKKNKSLKKSFPGVHSALSRPSKTVLKRSVKESSPQKGKPKKCIGCYTSLIVKGRSEILAPLPVIRKLRDTEEHEKLKKKHKKHRKEKSKSKRRNKNHRGAQIQEEDPEPDENRRMSKHKVRKSKQAGRFSIITSGTPKRKKNMDVPDPEDMTE